jgi:hypothetical protein
MWEELLQSFVSKTTPRTREPRFGVEHNFAIMRTEAHQLHLVVHQLQWKLGVLTPTARGAALLAALSWRTPSHAVGDDASTCIPLVSQ